MLLPRHSDPNRARRGAGRKTYHRRACGDAVGRGEADQMDRPSAARCRRNHDPKSVWPVCVSAGAFGENKPSRDLWLSPGHNIAAEGVLMPIKALQNGKTIVQHQSHALSRNRRRKRLEYLQGLSDLLGHNVPLQVRAVLQQLMTAHFAYLTSADVAVSGPSPTISGIPPRTSRSAPLEMRRNLATSNSTVYCAQVACDTHIVAPR